MRACRRNERSMEIEAGLRPPSFRSPTPNSAQTPLLPAPTPTGPASTPLSGQVLARRAGSTSLVPDGSSAGPFDVAAAGSDRAVGQVRYRSTGTGREPAGHRDGLASGRSSGTNGIAGWRRGRRLGFPAGSTCVDPVRMALIKVDVDKEFPNRTGGAPIQAAPPTLLSSGQLRSR